MAAKTRKAATLIKTEFCGVCGLMDKKQIPYGIGPAQVGVIKDSRCNTHEGKEPDWDVKRKT